MKIAKKTIKTDQNDYIEPFWSVFDDTIFLIHRIKRLRSDESCGVFIGLIRDLLNEGKKNVDGSM